MSVHLDLFPPSYCGTTKHLPACVETANVVYLLGAKGKDMQKLSKAMQNILLYTVLALYAIILFVFLLQTWGFFDANREIYRSLNLVPLRSMISYLFVGDISIRNFSIMNANVFGNIILFIPLGIYLPLFKCDKRIGVNVLLAFLISLSVEIIQYIFGIGASDIDDIILNTFGGFIGIVIYKSILYLFKDEKKTRLAIIIIGATISVPVLYLLTHLQIRIR